MPVTSNLRPGVYSSYTVDSTYSTPRSKRNAVLVMKGAAESSGRLEAFESYSAAVEQLGSGEENKHILACTKILFDSGVSIVFASVYRSEEESALAEALTFLEEQDGIGVVVSDAATKKERAALTAFLEKSAENQRECVAFTGAATAEEAVAAAGELGSERALVCCPASAPEGLEPESIYSAAAMAGAVVAEENPVRPWNNAPLEALAVCGSLPEAEVQRLLAAGVTVLEHRGGEVRCIRALTTRAGDRAMSPVNTILIIDDVMRSVREALSARLRGARASADTIRTQVMVELSAKQNEGVIEAFATPKVYADPADPAVCVVEIGFQVAHVLSQIHIAAHVRI